MLSIWVRLKKHIKMLLIIKWIKASKVFFSHTLFGCLSPNWEFWGRFVEQMTLGETEKVLQGQTLYLIGPIHNLWKNFSVVSIIPEAALTTLNFLHNLQMWPISQSVTLHSAKGLCSDKHSSLFWTFISYEENLVLWTWSQVFIFKNIIRN